MRAPTAPMSALPAAFAFTTPMTLPMSLMDAAPVDAMASAINASSSASPELRGQVGLQDGDLGVLFRDEIRARAFLERDDGFLALLDHLLEHGSDLRVVEHDALVDFALLDGGLQKTNDRETILFTGSHRGLHVFGDALFERHLRKLSSGADAPCIHAGCCA